MVIQKGLREVAIEPNHDGTWIAVYSVHGAGVESRTFKTQRGAVKWGNAKVSR